MATIMNPSSSKTTVSNPLPSPPQLVGNTSTVRISIPSPNIATTTVASLVTPPGQAIVMNPATAQQKSQQIPPVATNEYNDNGVIVESSTVEIHSSTAIITEDEDIDHVDDGEVFMIDDIPGILESVENDDGPIRMEDLQSRSEHPVQPHVKSNSNSNVASPNVTTATSSSSTSTTEKQQRRPSMKSATSVSSSNPNNAVLLQQQQLSSNEIDKEKVGRWTENEHTVFLEGLRTHGKQWKVIANMIGTRTVVQVRTHAQKYFQKLDRNSGGSGNGASSSSVTNTNAVPNVSKSATSSTSTNVPVVSSKIKANVSTTDATLLSPNSTILTTATVEQQPSTFVPQPKRKSLPSSLPSRNNNKKSRMSGGTGKMTQRLSMQNARSVRGNATTTSMNEENISSHPSYISKSSSSTGSDENWSTISPDNVIWDRIDFSHLSEYGSSKETVTTTSTYSDNSDPHNPQDMNTATFDMLVEDPLEWLIETDCSQQYLPESSLPLFPFHSITSSVPSDEHNYEEFNVHSIVTDSPMVNDDDDEPNMIVSIGCTTNVDRSTKIDIDNESLSMVDPNVTVQSLFLSSCDDADNSYMPTTMTVAEQ